MGRQPFQTRIDAGEPRTMRGDRGTSIPVVNGDRGNARQIDLHVNVLQPGTGPGPRHFHEVAENLYWVLEGTITVEAADARYELHSGDVLFIPPGIHHATMNLTEEPARFVEIYSPTGQDFHIVDGGDPR